MIASPCKGCEERHTACWSGCEKYLAYKQEVIAFNREQHRQHDRLTQANQRMWDSYTKDGTKNRRYK